MATLSDPIYCIIFDPNPKAHLRTVLKTYVIEYRNSALLLPVIYFFLISRNREIPATIFTQMLHKSLSVYCNCAKICTRQNRQRTNILRVKTLAIQQVLAYLFFVYAYFRLHCTKIRLFIIQEDYGDSETC